MPSKFKSKTLRPLFEGNEVAGDETDRRESLGADRFLGEDPKLVCTWLREHRNIQPLAHLRYKRSRFVGLGNSSAQGVWATLDGDIQMKRASLDDLGVQDETAEYEAFPHALLEVRWEGRDVPEVVHLLNGSHLVSSHVC
jgi:VTC domain